MPINIISFLKNNRSKLSPKHVEHIHSQNPDQKERSIDEKSGSNTTKN